MSGGMVSRVVVCGVVGGEGVSNALVCGGVVLGVVVCGGLGSRALVCKGVLLAAVVCRAMVRGLWYARLWCLSKWCGSVGLWVKAPPITPPPPSGTPPPHLDNRLKCGLESVFVRLIF